MTCPVRRLRGSYYLITRQVAHREFRLRPGQDLEHTLGVIIAHAAEVWAVKVLGICIMSNHLHVVAYDPEANLSDFMKQAHADIGRLMNYLHKVERSDFWAPASSDMAKELLDLDAVAEALAYVHTNPTSAGLVSNPATWPGLITHPKDIGTGKPLVFERPTGEEGRFFRDDGPVPKRAELVLHVPEGVDPAELRRRVQASVKRRVKEKRAEMKRQGRTFLGVEAVKETGFFDRPKTAQRTNAGERAKPVERIGAADPELKKQGIADLREFHRTYRDRRRSIAQGDHEVELPAGTYHLVRHRGFGHAEHPPPESVFRATWVT